MLSWEYPPYVVGGLARHTYHLSCALQQQGVEVHVMTLGQAEDSQHSLEEGVHVHRIAVQRQHEVEFTTTVMETNLTFLEESLRVLDTPGAFDLIHAHDWLVFPAARSLKHLFRLPLVATIHATEHGRCDGLHTLQQHYISRLEWELTYEAWRVILCSQFMKEDLQSFFDLPLEKMAVIPNGIIAPVEPGFLPVVRRKPMVLFVGRLVPEKGVRTLIGAMSAVLESCPESWCVIAGTGPMVQELQDLSTARGVTDRVIFTGYVDDAILSGLYRTAKVAVFPSFYEPFGIVALEAMAGGAPTIVSDVGGLGEIVEHRVNGHKVQPGDEEQLAAEIIGLLHQPEEGQRLVDEAYHRLRHQFSWAEIARQTLSVYRGICVEHASTSWKQDRERPFGLEGARAWGRRMMARQYKGRASL